MAVKRLARLHEVRIGLGPSVSHFAQLKFLRQANHIGIMFGRYLHDEYQYVLDGSSSILLHFGMSEKIQATYGKDYYFQDRNKWSCCGVSQFDLAKFTASSESEQDEMTTKVVEKALLAVAKKVGADAKPIRAIAKRIRADNFTADFLIKRFSCASPDRKFTAHVWANVARGVVRWKVGIVDAAERVVYEEWIPDSIFKHPDVAEDKLLPKWDKRGFSLRNDKGMARYLLAFQDASAKPKDKAANPKRGGIQRRSRP